MKPIKEIRGRLAGNLEKGYRAIVWFSKNDAIMTSQVVDVRSMTEDGAEFETQNTVYKLTKVCLEEFPDAA